MKKIILILSIVFNIQLLFGQKADKYNNYWPFSEGLAIVELNGKYGYVNEKWEEITPLKYDDAFDFKEGLAGVVINKKFGYINKKGELVIPLKYDSAPSFLEGVSIVKLNGKFGLINQQGKELSSIKYDRLLDFKEGLAVVEIDKKRGYINKKGEEVIPLKYDAAYSFSEGSAIVKLNGKFGLINQQGKELGSIKYDQMWAFSEGFAPVKLNNKYGQINKKGEEIIPLEYDFLSEFHEGLILAKLNNGYGFLNTKGKVAIPLQFVEAGDFYDGLARVKTRYEYGVRWSFIDKKGKQTDEYFENADDYSRGGLKGLARVRSHKNGKLGFRDVNGKYVVPCEYHTIMMNKDNPSWKVDEGFALVLKEDKFGIANQSGIFVPCTYDYIGSVTTAYPIVVQSGGKFGKFGLIDHTGKEILPLKYDWITNFNADKEELAYAEKDGKEFYIDKKGNFAEEVNDEKVKEKYAKVRAGLERMKQERNNTNTNTNTNNSTTKTKSNWRCPQCGETKVSEDKPMSGSGGCRYVDNKGSKRNGSHQWKKQ